MKMVLGFLIVLVIAALVAWLWWGPLLHFLISLIPANAAFAWIGKLICVFLVGYFGGIGIPLVILIFGFVIVFNVFN